MRQSFLLRAIGLSMALWCGIWSAPGCAEWQRDLPGAVQIGQGQFTWYGVPIYHASLWSAAKPAGWEHPFALELVYRRDLSRETLVQSSIDEMQRLRANDEGLLTRWAGEMRKAFVDVRAGQRITGVYLPGQGCRFYVDGAFRHAVADSGFARAFFSIWLDRRTRNPELRRELLGLNGVDEP